MEEAGFKVYSAFERTQYIGAEPGPWREIWHVSEGAGRTELVEPCASNFMLNAKGLYVGAYVCERCRMTSDGVYDLRTPSGATEWLCRGCKEAVTTQREQPALAPSGETNS